MVERVTSGLAERLRQLRERAGLSQRALSSLAGLSPSEVRLLESRERMDPRARVLVSLARTLGVTTDFLLNGEGELPSPEALATALHAARERKEAA
jgi:transcriptional regulator with XRE-family HTH domain